MEGPIYPKAYSNSQIDASGHYVCPFCRTQTTSDREDIGWVRCPMIYNKPIGLACCTDFQGVALSEHFETHSYYALFTEAANITGQEVITLRQICLDHQEEVAKEKMENLADKSENTQLEQHLIENYSRLITEIKRIKTNSGFDL